MPGFDIVLGIVLDYVHGVLMGVTKTTVSKWFSPSQSKQPFVIGNHLHSISKRLTGIKPPNYIERLPRNLEKHFAHLKARIVVLCNSVLAGVLVCKVSATFCMFVRRDPPSSWGQHN